MYQLESTPLVIFPSFIARKPDNIHLTEGAACGRYISSQVRDKFYGGAHKFSFHPRSLFLLQVLRDGQSLSHSIVVPPEAV